MFKTSKKVISLFVALMVVICFTVPAMATTSSDLFNPEESAYATNLPVESNTQEIEPEPRPANLVSVQAFEVKPGVIRCTILNTGIDRLDNVKVYVEFSNPKGDYTSTERDYGKVGFFAVHEDISIGTNWTSATAYWTITDGGEVYEMKDKVGE